MSYSINSAVQTLPTRNDSNIKQIRNVLQSIKSQQVYHFKLHMSYQDRGVHNYQVRHYQAALEDLTKAIAQDPDNKIAHLYKGFTLHAIAKYQEAVEQYTITIKLDERDVNAFKGRGMAYHKLGKYKQSIYDYIQAIRLDPQDVEAFYSRGLTYKAIKDYRSAQADFIKAMKLYPQHPLYLFNMVVCYWQRGHKQKAIYYFNKGAKYVNWKESQYLSQKFLIEEKIVQYVKGQIKQFLEVMTQIEELQSRTKKRGKIDLQQRLQQIGIQCYQSIIKHLGQLQRQHNTGHELVLQYKAAKKIIRDQLVMLGAELSKIMIKKKSSTMQQIPLNRQNPEELKLIDQAKIVAQRAFLNKNVLRKIEYLDERIKEYYELFYVSVIEHMLAFQFTANTNSLPHSTITSLSDLLHKLKNSQLILEQISILGDLMTAPFDIGDDYFDIRTNTLHSVITTKNKIFRFRNEQLTCEYIAYAMEKLMANEIFNRRLMLVLDYKDSSIVKAQLDKIGRTEEGLGQFKGIYTYVGLLVSMHVTLITKALYELELEAFKDLTKQKEEMYELISTSIFPKLKQTSKQGKTSSDSSKKDREMEFIPRVKKQRKASIGCGGQICLIY